MHGIPRVALAESPAIVMSKLGALRGCARRPVAAREIVAGWKRRAVRPRPGKDVMDVRRVADAVHLVEFFGDGSVLVDCGLVAVQLVDVGRDQETFGVV